MFTNTYWPFVGGIEKSVQVFTKLLREEDHKTLVITPEFPGGEESDELVLRLPAIKRFNGTDFSMRIPLPGLIPERLNEFQPDIIHSHHPFMLGDSALRMARQRDVPLIFTHHTLWERYTHYVPLDGDAMTRFATNLPTEYANLCDYVIAPSQSIKELITERGVTKPVKVIPTGIDVDFYAGGNRDEFRDKHGIDGNTTVIGHLGRISREKNTLWLGRSIIHALKSNEDAVYLVVGDGDSLEDLKKLFEDEKLGGRLIATGTLEGQDVADAYAAMNTFVFASVTDTQGLVLAEAMASGSPVIAIDAPGSRDIIDDNQNGLLLDHDCKENEFGEAVANLIGNEDRIYRMSEQAVETAQKYDQRKCANALIELYDAAKDASTGTNTETIGVWDSIAQRLQAEWDLIKQKSVALSSMIDEKTAS